MNLYYPLFLNIKGKKSIVIGGGQVSLRKVKSLLKYGAEITVISPKFCVGLRELASRGRIKLLCRGYRASDLENACIAVSASNDNRVNKEVAKQAKEKKVLINIVDDAGLSDFIVPSSVSRGDLAIAISTGGNSPALAKSIRIKLEKEFGKEYAILVRLLGEIRSELSSQGIRFSGNVWQKALDVDNLAGLIQHGKSGEAKATLLKKLKG